MMRFPARLLVFVLFLCTFGLVPFSYAQQSRPANAGAPGRPPSLTRPPIQRQKPPFLRKVGMMFEANRGQAGASVNFVSIGEASTVALQAAGITLTAAKAPSSPSSSAPFQLPEAESKPSSPAVVRIRFLGANENAEPKPGDALPCKVSEYGGSDPKQWRLDIPAYSSVRYPGVYPGIDVSYHGQSRELEYDFTIAPGADPKVIRVALEGIEGLLLDRGGDLVLRVKGGEMRQRKPIAYQEIDGERKDVQVGYLVRPGNQIGLQVGPYDNSKPLIIDPVLSYAAFSGDVLTDFGSHIAVDSSGNAYVAGRTSSGVNYDALLAKYDPSGTLLWWKRFKGANTNGDRDDFASGVALDGSGNIYLVGTTSSYNFPITAGAFSTQCGGPPGNCNQNISGVRKPDAFVMKLDTAGNIVYSSFFGGPFAETANAIAVDPDGMAYITGGTIGGSIPVKGGFTSTHTGGNCPRDAYIAKFDMSQSGANSLVFSTLLGGDGNDEGTALAVVPRRRRPFGQPNFVGSIYVAGITGWGCTADLNSKFPTTAGAFAADGGLTQSAFITLIDSGGTQIQYSSVLPGATNALGVAADSSRSGYITGSASAGLSVTQNAFQTQYKSGFSDAYVARFDPAKSGAASLAYSTYLGGAGEDWGNDIAVDFSGRATVTGMTRATDFPVTPNAIQSTKQGGTCGTQNYPCPDVFVSRLNRSGAALDFSTYLGGTSYDEGMGVALGPGTIYVTGKTYSSDFPVTNGTTYQGNYDVFVGRITLGSDLTVTKTATPDPAAAGDNVTYTVRVTNNGPDDSPDVRLFDAIPGGYPNSGSATLVSAFPAHGTCQPPSGGVLSCDLGPLAKNASTTVTIVVQSTGMSVLRNAASVQGATEDSVPSNNMTSLYTTVNATADLAVAVYQTPANPVGLGTNLTYTVQVSNNGPDIANPVQLQLPINGFTLVSYSPNQISCTGTTVLTCDIGLLVGTHNAGTSAQILTFTLAPAATGTFTNTAAVSGNVNDPNPANDTASVTSQLIAGQPALDARVEDVRRLNAGTIQVTANFRNVGTGLANNVSMTQVTPQVVAGGGAVSLAQPALPYAMGNLAVGSSVNVVFVINAPLTVKSISLNESGTMRDFAGNPVNFALSQTIRIP